VTAYVDASVLLRLAFGQPDSLGEWSKIDRGVSSALVTTESLRTLDRLRLRVKLADSEVAARRAKILELIASLEIVDIDSVVLDRAAQPMPTELGTLADLAGTVRKERPTAIHFSGHGAPGASSRLSAVDCERPSMRG